jgi:hypothetical protein
MRPLRDLKPGWLHEEIDVIITGLCYHGRGFRGFLIKG